MSFGKMQVTNKGTQLLAKAAAGATLKFTRIKMGDGQLSGQVIETMEDVVHEVISLKLNEPTVGKDYTTISGNFRNTAVQDDFIGNGTKTAFQLSASPTALTSVKINDIETTSYTYSAGVVTFSSAPAQGDKIKIVYNLEQFFWREVAFFALDPDEGEILFEYQNAYNLAEPISAASSEIVEKVVAIALVISSKINVEVQVSESLVLMPLAQGQYKTALLQDTEVIKGGELLPLYDQEEEKDRRVTVDKLVEYAEGKMKTRFAEKPAETAITLEASKWNQETKSYSYEEEFPNSEYDIIVELNGGQATDEQTEAWDAANIKGNYPENILYAKGDIPTVDIPIIRQVIKK